MDSKELGVGGFQRERENPREGKEQPKMHLMEWGAKCHQGGWKGGPSRSISLIGARGRALAEPAPVAAPIRLQRGTIAPPSPPIPILPRAWSLQSNPSSLRANLQSLRANLQSLLDNLPM